MLPSIKTLNGVLEDIRSLQNDRELLEEIWTELGPYENTISDTLRYKIRDHFNFDDSE